MVAVASSVNHLTAAVPLYIQIAEGLLHRIESGELAPGDRLPAERALSEMLGVNRMTVRQALHLLATQGLLDRRQGAGTYVAEPKIERETGRLVPFSKGMQSKGYATGAKVIMLEQRTAELSISRQLNLPVSAAVYYGHRLRLLNQTPVMLEKFILPAPYFPDLERQDLENRSLYEILEREYGVIISQARQSLEAVNASEYEAKWLKVEPGASLMLEQRLSFDQNGRPVEYAKDLYRGDRFRFVAEVITLDRL